MSSRKPGSGDSHSGLTKDLLAQVLGDAGVVREFPSEMKLPIDGKEVPVVVQYAFDGELQSYMENLMKSYRPDYGAFVAIDAGTGRVLSMVSYAAQRGDGSENLALRATFPAASIFKVVTAAAAIAEKNFSAYTVIPFDGRNHTLYRSNVFKTRYTRWTRYMTLKDAFAKSVNTVFGKIGVHTVGADQLRLYADRFGFNRRIAADVPVQEGRAVIPDDPWELAESASGFTRDTTMSPLQGALIAAAVVNGGVMMEPYVVQSVHSGDGSELYQAEAKIGGASVDPDTAGEVRALMKETIRSGTSRKHFRGFFKGDFSEVEVGGKTGSLTGLDPAGKYDWFVGFADDGKGKKIAIAALTIAKKYWRVKSSYLARRGFERYLKEPQSDRSVAADSKRGKKSRAHL